MWEKVELERLIICILMMSGHLNSAFVASDDISPTLNYGFPINPSLPIIKCVTLPVTMSSACYSHCSYEQGSWRSFFFSRWTFTPACYRHKIQQLYPTLEMSGNSPCLLHRSQGGMVATHTKLFSFKCYISRDCSHILRCVITKAFSKCCQCPCLSFAYWFQIGIRNKERSLSHTQKNIWQGSVVPSIGAHMVFILVSEYYLKVKTLCMWFQHLECSQSTPQWYHSEVTAHCHGDYKSL